MDKAWESSRTEPGITGYTWTSADILLTRFTSRVKTRIHQHESVVETQQGPADTAQIGLVFFLSLIDGSILN